MMEINSEQLAYWYFRLNGFFTIQNLVIHQSEASRQLTEIDILGVRLKNRRELSPDNIIVDDVRWSGLRKNVLVIAEATTSKDNKKVKSCNVRSSLFDRDKGIQELILNFVGCFQDDEINNVATDIYDYHGYSGDSWAVIICGLGDKENAELRENILQLTWRDVLGFIYNRFTVYEKQKKDHAQWDSVGRGLFNLSTTAGSEDNFVKMIRILPGRG